jgi:hypothetical protein
LSFRAIASYTPLVDALTRGSQSRTALVTVARHLTTFTGQCIYSKSACQNSVGIGFRWRYAALRDTSSASK